MRKLYNKIYKAINEGVVKSLQIDGETPVSYQRNKVNDGMYSKELFDEAIDNFFNERPDEKYKKIIKYSMDGIHQYKVKNYNEIHYIYDKISKLIDNIDLSWIDFTDLITVIMKNDDELSLNDVTDINNVIFIKFNNIDNIDYPIIIHKNLLYSEQIWSNKQSKIKAIDDKDGYKNTYSLRSNILNGYPAFEYCINQSINEYKGYLPAYNELKFLRENEKLVNYVLKYINGKQININANKWWSSTQYDATYAESEKGTAYPKTMSRYVLPLFRKN